MDTIWIMRTIHLVALASLAGCAATMRAPAPHGATRFEYRGGIELVFTNATPDAMCGLYLSDNADLDYGDNWLDSRVPSGASIGLRVKPGTYKARWETCATKGSLPTYSATLWRETGFDIERDTQLFAYVAEATPPTTRAPLAVDRVRVMFQGQAVTPADAQDPQIAHRGSPVVKPDAPTTMSFADYVEKPKPTKK